jgi:hypothetical protein
MPHPYKKITLYRLRLFLDIISKIAYFNCVFELEIMLKELFKLFLELNK